MAFPLLTDREILGLFDSEYDPREVSLDIRQIITDDLNFENFSQAFRRDEDATLGVSIADATTDQKNIYLEELFAANARSVGEVREEDHIKNLSTFDQYVYLRNKYFTFQALLGPVNAKTEKVGPGSPTAYVKPTNFINEFLVPKVEELVDFITLEDLEKLIENYSLSVK